MLNRRKYHHFFIFVKVYHRTTLSKNHFDLLIRYLIVFCRDIQRFKLSFASNIKDTSKISADGFLTIVLTVVIARKLIFKTCWSWPWLITRLTVIKLVCQWILIVLVLQHHVRKSKVVPIHLRLDGLRVQWASMSRTLVWPFRVVMIQTHGPFLLDWVFLGKSLVWLGCLHLLLKLIYLAK